MLHDLAVTGSAVLATDHDGSVWLFDLSDSALPSSPAAHLGVLDIESAVVADGQVAYMSNGATLAAIDISDPESPAELGRLALGHCCGVRLATSGGFVYALHGEGMMVVDASDPRELVAVGSIGLPKWSVGVAVAGDLALVTHRSSGPVASHGMIVIDVSVPQAPVELGRCATPERPWAVAVAGDMAYLTGNGIVVTVVDISDPSRPVVRGHQSTPDSFSGGDDIAVVPPYAVVSDYELGVSLVDIETCPPRRPSGRVRPD